MPIAAAGKFSVVLGLGLLIAARAAGYGTQPGPGWQLDHAGKVPVLIVGAVYSGGVVTDICW